MVVRSALPPLLAIGCACTIGLGPATSQTLLPSGNSEIFRQRIIDRTTPDLAPAPPRETPPPAAPRAKMPRLSSHYGYRADPIHGAGRMHHGLDIPGPLGTPVLASGSGLVAFAGRAGSYGQMVEIDHGGGLRTRYAHLSRLLVRSGDAVSPRQTIALMGSTGRSTSSHLHFEVRVNGRPTDPIPLLNQPTAHAPLRLVRIDSAPHRSNFSRRRAATRDSGGAEAAQEDENITAPPISHSAPK